MANFSVQVTLKMTSNVTADEAVNTFAVDDRGGTGDPDDLPAIFKTFYDAIDGIYSNSVAQNGHGIKVYDLGDAIPRAPVVDETWNFGTAPGGNTLPHQVAVCLSFQGPRVSGQSQARRRGRVYLGPLNTNGVNTSGRVLPANQTTIANAAADLITDLQAASWDWGVFSRVEDGILALVTNGWVDDTFDIQRRRQRESISRVVFP